MGVAVGGSGREVRLVEVPEGLPEERHLTVAEVPVPVPGPGEVLVRNRHFMVFAALRTLMGGTVRDAPLPPLLAGDTLFGPAIGEVVAASDAEGPQPGEQVLHMLGWREYAVVAREACVRLDGTLPDPVAHLNQGTAAYGALTRLAAIRPGDTVLVTGAAGAVGSLAGQIARLLGAGRVIGTTGSARKGERLVAEVGYDAAVLRGGDGPGSFAERLAGAAPDGVDVLLDNVGGEQLAAAVGAARQGARFALVGALSGQLAAGGGGGAPVAVDSYRLILKGVSLRGYAGTDHPEMGQEWTARFGEWLRSGAIRFPHTRIAGIDEAPRAFTDMVRGRHFGTVIVDV
ncbi:MDR family NADP-dependent oxidoreductase [Actinacidiphila yanglinensis]|nr:NADP-dependent oxidoreductase [Actinacidiphila yanglinensis]